MNNIKHMMNYMEPEVDYPIEFQEKSDEMAFKRQVEEWYEQYGEIYTTEINGIIFVFRGISQYDMKKARSLYPDDLDKSEFICRLAVLEPIIEDYENEIYAGIPEILAQQILIESGFSNNPAKVNALLNVYEARANEKDVQVLCIIKEVFQDIPFKEMERWPIEKVLEYYSMAKWTLETLRGITLESEES